MNKQDEFDFDGMDLYSEEEQQQCMTMAGAQLHLKTAPSITEALVQMVRSGRYGWLEATDHSYLKTVADWMETTRHWPVKEEWIVPSYGIMRAMSACMRAFSQKGDGIIIQPPVYPKYKQAILNNHRVVVYNPLVFENGHYRMDLEDLERKMAARENTMLLLCNPHSPIMDAWDRDTLKKVAALARTYGVRVIVDEVYADQMFSGTYLTPYGALQESRDNCVIFTGIAKAFNFNCISQSNIIIPDATLRKSYIRERNKDYYTSLNPFVKTAVMAAYTQEGRDWLDALTLHVTANIRYMESWLETYFPMVKLCRHTAGTLVWLDFRDMGMSEEELMDFFEEGGLKVEMGSMYGPEGAGFVRMQVGICKKELAEVLCRLRQAGEKYHLIPKGIAFLRKRG